MTYRDTPEENQPVDDAGSALRDESSCEDSNSSALTGWPRFKTELKKAFSDRRLVLLTVIWILITLLQVLLVSVRMSDPADMTESRQLKLFNRILYLYFYRADSGAFTGEFIDAFISQAEVLYGDEQKKHPDDGKLAYRRAILLSLLGKKQEARLLLGEHEKQIDNPEIINIIRRVHLGREGEEEPAGPEDSAGSDEPRGLDDDEKEILAGLVPEVEENLTGFYRDITLYRIYNLIGETSLAGEVSSRAAGENRWVFVGLAALGFLMIVGFVLGPLMLLAGLVATFFFSGITLGAQGVGDLSNRMFGGLTVKNAIVLFLCWEIARFVLGNGAALLFYRAGGMTPPVLFVVYSVLYTGTVILGIKLYNSTGFSFSNGSIGLPGRDFLRWTRDAFIGVATYMAAVPVVILGALLLQMVTRETSTSSNPAFEIIKSADTPGKLMFLFLIIGVLGPVFEEILFRGFLYTTVRKYLSAGVASVGVALLFALIHYDPGVLFQLFILGFLLSIIYERTGSLVPAIVTHCIWNSFVFVVSVSIYY